MTKSEKIQKGIVCGVVASEGIHIFCCALPTVFSVMSLLAGMGMITSMPGVIDKLHHAIHDYEIPMIIVSGIILTLGWVLYLYAKKLNCSEDGNDCCHEPCAPKKNRTKVVMMIATLLFAINVTVYFGFHRDNDIDSHEHHEQMIAE